MKRKIRLATIILSLLLLLPIVMALPVLPMPDTLNVPKTSATIVVDGSLNMGSEWNGSAIIVWYNPICGCELDRIYLLHNSTHYLLGGILYDPDNKVDDYLLIYVDWGFTYKYKIDEDSSSAVLYNITDGLSSLASNATVVMTRTTHSVDWIYFEMAVPKDEWGSVQNVTMYFEHVNTDKLQIVGRYPTNANSTDKSKWLHVVFKQVLGQYSVQLTFKDRDGNPINYVANMSYAVIRFLNGTYYASLALNDSSINTLLPPENYTITFYVYDIPIFNTTLEVTANVSMTYSLDNLKYAVTALGDIIATVELPGEIGSIVLEPENKLGVLISNSTKSIALRLYPSVNWNYTFVIVLNAFNFTYNPFTGNLLAYAHENMSGIMMVGAPEGYPVFYFADGTVKGYVYNHELEELSSWVLNGTYMIYSSKPPFAVTLNNTALKKGADYSVDPFNVTSVEVGDGELRAYYKNPTEIRLEIVEDKAMVIIVTPYSFSGKIALQANSSTVKTVTFKSIVPLTTVDLSLEDLEPGNYTIKVTVTDEDSQQTLGTASAAYSINAGAPAQIPWQYYLALIAIIIIAVAVTYAFSATYKAAISEVQKRRKFVKKKQ